MNQFIIGGSGSTGSSLLKNILYRHPRLFGGGETSLFAKHRVYTHWQQAKYLLTKKGVLGLRNAGYHLLNGTNLTQEEYCWTKDEVDHLAKRSKTFTHFCHSFFKRPMKAKNADIWFEKTPANVACFSYFLDVFTGGCIHIVRNPYDTIASLLRRGYAPHYAVGIYLLNTASGLKHYDDPKVHTIRYEDLVKQPEDSIMEICRFLKISFFPDMLMPGGEHVKESKLKGWQYDETQEIGKKSVGRFYEMPEQTQNLLLEYIQGIEISPAGKDYFGVQINGIRDICMALDYDYLTSKKNTFGERIKKDLSSDRRLRLRRGYWTGVKYPLRFVEQI